MDDTMKVEKADIEDIDSLVELRLDYLIEDKSFRCIDSKRIIVLLAPCTWRLI